MREGDTEGMAEETLIEWNFERASVATEETSGTRSYLPALSGVVDLEAV